MTNLKQRQVVSLMSCGRSNRHSCSLQRLLYHFQCDREVQVSPPREPITISGHKTHPDSHTEGFAIEGVRSVRILTSFLTNSKQPSCIPCVVACKRIAVLRDVVELNSIKTEHENVQQSVPYLVEATRCCRSVWKAQTTYLKDCTFIPVAKHALIEVRASIPLRNCPILLHIDVSLFARRMYACTACSTCVFTASTSWMLPMMHAHGFAFRLFPLTTEARIISTLKSMYCVVHTINCAVA